MLVWKLMTPLMLMSHPTFSATCTCSLKTCLAILLSSRKVRKDWGMCPICAMSMTALWPVGVAMAIPRMAGPYAVVVCGWESVAGSV